MVAFNVDRVVSSTTEGNSKNVGCHDAIEWWIEKSGSIFILLLLYYARTGILHVLQQAMESTQAMMLVIDCQLERRYL